MTDITRFTRRALMGATAMAAAEAGDVGHD